MGHIGTHAASVALYPKLAYDPRTDFEPIAQINGAAIVVAARKDLPPKDFKEFVAYLKANETKLNQAHAGVGAVSYITCELLNGIIGIKPVGVPFQGTGPAMNALVGGQVDYMCDQITNVVPQVNGGTIKAYAVATPDRAPSLPNLPTSAEGGLPNYQASAWNALFAPKGTSKAIIEKVNAAAVKALDDEKVIARMKELGNDIPKPDQRKPEALGKLVKDEVEKWGKFLKPVG
jgi:tripartite-type tricarboxylate transporter receptor subunit TctC